MTRHRNEAANLRIDRRRLRVAAVVACLLLAAALGMLFAGSMPETPTGRAAWPIASEVTEPRPHPHFTPATVTVTTAAKTTPEATSAPAPPASTTTARSTPAPSSRARTTTVEPPARSPAEPVESSGGGSSVAQELLEMVNAVRDCEQPVTLDGALVAFAQTHSLEQADSRSMYHSGGPSGWRTWGENVAAGYPDPAAVMDGWMSSDGHRENIENCNFTRMGAGSAADPTGRLYWTQVFAG